MGVEAGAVGLDEVTEGILVAAAGRLEQFSLSRAGARRDHRLRD
jgi:hypothetical protein